MGPQDHGPLFKCHHCKGSDQNITEEERIDAIQRLKQRLQLRMNERPAGQSVMRMASQKTKHGLIREPQRSHQRARSNLIGNYVAESGHVMRPFGRARTDERSHQRAPSIYLPCAMAVMVQDQFNQALWAVAVVPAGKNITRASKCLGIGREVSLLRLAQASSSISPLNVVFSAL